MGEWISVKERLPEKMVEVLIVAYGGEIVVAHIDDTFPNVWLSCDEIALDITHWMPLPKLPKREG